MPFRPSRFAPIVLATAMVAGHPAFAVSRDMVQLQTQLQQLQDTVARLQQSNDERMGVLNNLVQQNVDQTNKIANIVDALQRQLQTQQESGGGKIDQVSGQVQALNDSLDEIKSRLGRLEKSLSDMRSQQQNLPAPPASSEPAAAPADSGSLPPTATTNPPTAVPDGFSNAVAQPAGKPSAAIPADGAAAPSGQTAEQLYKSALTDYMSAKYGLASSEFADLIRAYPDNPLAGNAFYYQGEIEYRGARFGNAVTNYDHVLSQFPQSNKVPAAHLHKGQALVQLKQTEAASREFRSLIARFPNSPEALQAKSRLSTISASSRAR